MGGRGSSSGISSRIRAMSADEALKVSNGGDSSSKGEYMRNCQRCVWAYEMNRRGYNVEAIGRKGNDKLGNDLNWLSIAKNAKPEYISKGPFARNTNASNAKRVEEKMAKWGDGSRAIIQIRTSNGQGHVFNVEYKNNKVTVYDSQTSTKSSSLSKYLSSWRADTTFPRIVRTDNLKLNKSEFDKYVRKRKKR